MNEKQWGIFVINHVIPLDDLKAHDESSDCWCNPRLEGDRRLVVHNAADNRRKFEHLKGSKMSDSIDKAFPAHEQLKEWPHLLGHQEDSTCMWIKTADILNEFTRLKSLCAEMGEALDLGTGTIGMLPLKKDEERELYLKKEKALLAYQSVLKGGI